MTSLSPLQGVNIFVSAGSVDGVAGTAACIRHSKSENVQTIFTQASLVHKIDVSQWPPNSKVGFIDLSVNNQGPNPKQITIDFVKRIYESGHTILFIADEHGKKDWSEVLEQCGHSKNELTIKPKNREKYSSTCTILSKAFGESADAHTKALLKAGDLADQMIFEGPGEMINSSIKSNISDPVRRPHIAKHMAEYEVPDAKMQAWMEEYAEIKANQPQILASRKDEGDGISLYDCTIGRHDATALFSEAYKTSSVVVLVGTTVFLDNEKQSGISIATNRKDLNVLDIIQKAGVVAGGMAAKANFALKDQNIAIEAVHNAIKMLSH